MKSAPILFALVIAGCAQLAPWAVKYQQWAPYDRNGVSIAEGDFECDEQADKATSNIGGLADRVLNFNMVKGDCLRQRGY